MDKDIEYLGVPVKFTATYRRKWSQREKPDDPHRRKQNWKTWEVDKFPEREGILIGRRNLSNGINHWDSEAGNMYEAKDYFQAYLVAYDLRKKPVLVPAMRISFPPPKNI